MKLRNKKTGVIGELSGVNRIVVYEPDMLLCENSILGEYDTLAELNKDWEDYKPTDPLIKDEKIRKAVKAWAKANGAWLLLVVSSYRIEISQVDAEILFNDPVFKELPRDRQLTIEELCGEEL